MFSRVLGVIVVAMSAVACGSADDGQKANPKPVASEAGSVSTSPADDLLPQFCEQFGALDGERPEEYVGSAEHVADIESLLAVSPADVTGPLATYRGYLASGAIDSIADPDSNLFDNWPADVQAAILEIQQFGSTNC